MKFAIKNLNKKTKEEIALEMYTFHNKRLQELYTTREEEKEEENGECEEKIDSVVEKQNNNNTLQKFSDFITDKFQKIDHYKIDNKWWWCGNEVAKLFGYLNYKNTINILKCPKITYKNIVDLNILTDSMLQPSTVFIEKRGIFQLVLTSTMPLAVQFQDLLIDDIIPSILQNGMYISPSITSQQLETLQTQLETERQEKLRIEQEKEQLQLQLYQRPSLDLVFQNRIVNEQYKTEYIYIITSKQYAEQKIFKVGRTNDTKKRLVSLNTSNITDNQQLYVCDKFPCFNACKVEETLFLILHNYRYTTKREFFVFNYHSLKKLVECVCIHNKQQYELFHDIINTEQHQLIPSYIPPPLSTHYNTNDTKKTKIDQFFSNV